jgi:hypothetical protein
VRISVKPEITSTVNRQAFSTTDLAKDIKNSPGIVYPLAEAKWQTSISSIVDHNRNDRVELAHSEARLCNVEGNVIKYYKGRCISYVRDPEVTIKPSIAETFFEIPEKVVGEGYFVTDRVPKITKFIEELKNFWDKCDYKPSTDFVKPENLTKKTYKFPATIYSYSGLTYNTNPEKSVNDLYNIDFYVSYINNRFKDSECIELKTKKEFTALAIGKAQKYLCTVSKDYLNLKEVPSMFGDSKKDLEESYLDLLMRIEDDFISY